MQRAERALDGRRSCSWWWAGSALLITAADDPVDWVNQRFDEFQQGSDPELEESRFAFNAGSERYDYWRVALDDAVDDPLVGSGGGGFQYSYNREGESEETPRDAHSVELELLSEQGILALLAFIAFVIAVVVAALRSRRLGPASFALVSAAMGAGAYWLVHASIEWFWTYPGVTAPVMWLLGAACAPAMLAPDRGRPPRWMRVAGAAVAIVLLATTMPPYLSERYTNEAYKSWRTDTDGAYRALDRAASLNPFSDAPLLAEGAIAREEGDDERALAAFREAMDRKPDEWAGHYYLALLLAPDDPEAAREELEIAQQLSPRSDDVASALDEIEAQQGGNAPPGPLAAPERRAARNNRLRRARPSGPKPDRRRGGRARRRGDPPARGGRGPKAHRGAAPRQRRVPRRPAPRAGRARQGDPGALRDRQGANAGAPRHPAHDDREGERAASGRCSAASRGRTAPGGCRPPPAAVPVAPRWRRPCRRRRSPSRSRSRRPRRFPSPYPCRSRRSPSPRRSRRSPSPRPRPSPSRPEPEPEEPTGEPELNLEEMPPSAPRREAVAFHNAEASALAAQMATAGSGREDIIKALRASLRHVGPRAPGG